MKKHCIWVIITAVTAIIIVFITIYIFHSSHGKPPSSETSESAGRIPVYSDTLYLKSEEEITLEFIENIVDFEFPDGAYIEQAYIKDYVTDYPAYTYFTQHYEIKIIVPLAEAETFMEACRNRMQVREFTKMTIQLLPPWDSYTYKDVSYCFASENVIFDYEYGGRYYHTHYSLDVIIEEDNYTILLGIN